MTSVTAAHRSIRFVIYNVGVFCLYPVLFALPFWLFSLTNQFADSLIIISSHVNVYVIDKEAEGWWWNGRNSCRGGTTEKSRSWLMSSWKLSGNKLQFMLLFPTNLFRCTLHSQLTTILQVFHSYFLFFFFLFLLLKFCLLMASWIIIML